MNKYDDIEKILEKLAKENPKGMDKIDEIDDSVFDRIESKALSNISNSVPERSVKKKNYIFLKVAVGFVGLFAAFSATLYFMDISNTRAADDISKKYEENVAPTFEPHEINIPQYIPEGYNLEYMTSGVDYNGDATIEIKYIKNADENQYILIRVYGDRINYSNNYDKQIRELVFNDNIFILTIIESDPVTIHADFLDGWGDRVQIMTTVDEETLIKIMESMK